MFTLDAVNAGVTSARRCFHSAPLRKNGFRPIIASISLWTKSAKSLSANLLKSVRNICRTTAGSKASSCGVRKAKWPTKRYWPRNFLWKGIGDEMKSFMYSYVLLLAPIKDAWEILAHFECEEDLEDMVWKQLTGKYLRCRSTCFSSGSVHWECFPLELMVLCRALHGPSRSYDSWLNSSTPSSQEWQLRRE